MKRSLGLLVVAAILASSVVHLAIRELGCSSTSTEEVVRKPYFSSSSSEEEEQKEGVAQEERCEGGRVAVCFYGLNRSLRHTMASMSEKLFGPLERSKLCADVFFHTWTIKAVEDQHNGEKGVPLGGPWEMFRLLGKRVKRYAIDDQDFFDKFQSNFSKFDPLDHRFRGPNFRNLLRQLESLKRVAQLLSLENHDYQAVLFVRPDLKLLDEVNVSQVLDLDENDFLTPYWGKYTGLNDRLAAAKPRAARKFAYRKDLAYDFAKSRGFIRSEHFLRWTIVEHFNLRPLPWNLRAQRVRATGKVADNDVCLDYCHPDKPLSCKGDCRALIPPDMHQPPRPLWADLQKERDRIAGKTTKDEDHFFS